MDDCVCECVCVCVCVCVYNYPLHIHNGNHTWKIQNWIYNIKQGESEGKAEKPNEIKKTETQGQGSDGNTELPESKR